MNTQVKFVRKLDEKVSKTMLLAFFILIIGAIITYYQNKISEIVVPEKVTAVVVSRTINKGEIISGNHLKEIEIYEPDKLLNGINDMSKLIGKIALTTIIKGKEITEEEITTKENWFNENERELGITFKHFTDIVGGKALPGDVVDIMLSYPPKENENGEIIIKEPELVVDSIKLEDILNENNISYKYAKDKDSFKPYTVLVKLTEEEEAKIDIACKKGRLYLRRHGNYIHTEIEQKEEKSKIIITGS